MNFIFKQQTTDFETIKFNKSDYAFWWKSFKVVNSFLPRNFSTFLKKEKQIIKNFKEESFYLKLSQSKKIINFLALGDLSHKLMTDYQNDYPLKNLYSEIFTTLFGNFHTLKSLQDKSGFHFKLLNNTKVLIAIIDLNSEQMHELLPMFLTYIYQQRIQLFSIIYQQNEFDNKSSLEQIIAASKWYYQFLYNPKENAINNKKMFLENVNLISSLMFNCYKLNEKNLFNKKNKLQQIFISDINQKKKTLNEIYNLINKQALSLQSCLVLDYYEPEDKNNKLEILFNEINDFFWEQNININTASFFYTKNQNKLVFITENNFEYQHSFSSFYVAKQCNNIASEEILKPLFASIELPQDYKNDTEEKQELFSSHRKINFDLEDQINDTNKLLFSSITSLFKNTATKKLEIKT